MGSGMVRTRRVRAARSKGWSTILSVVMFGIANGGEGRETPVHILV